MIMPLFFQERSGFTVHAAQRLVLLPEHLLKSIDNNKI